MNLRPAAAEHAYDAIKTDLLRGRFSPGTALNVHTLSIEMGLSISPVRDAMGRLVGERLVVLRPEGGFQSPAINEAIASDMYRWNARLLLWAIRDQTQGSESPSKKLAAIGFDRDAGAIAAMTAELFRAIASFSGSFELGRSVDAMSDRLAALRHRETMLRDRVSELRGIVEGVVANDDRRLHDAIVRYHQRRLRQVGAIVALLHIAI